MPPPQREDFTILGIFLGAILGVYVALEVVTAFVQDDPTDRYWVTSLVFNLLGYSTIFVPGYLVINYVRKSGYLERGAQKCMEPVIRLCVFGSEETIGEKD